MGHALVVMRRPLASSRSVRERGQAAVESALVLPLTIFLVLGSLQLFMMFQARVMAEYAAFRATRAGSVNHGDCEAMNHAALAALLPTLRTTTNADELSTAFGAVKDNRFGDGYTTSVTGIENEEVVWIFRESPLASDIPDMEDRAFDARFSEPMQLRVRLVYWYPMRIPFADWVIYRAAAASMGVAHYAAQNPLMVAGKADWRQESSDVLTGEVLSRVSSNVSSRKYLFPIQASHTMRMMTPAKQQYFEGSQNCF